MCTYFVMRTTSLSLSISLSLCRPIDNNKASFDRHYVNVHIVLFLSCTISVYHNDPMQIYRQTKISNLTAVPGVGSSPALSTCETSQLLLVGVRWFSRGTPVSPHLPIGSPRYE